MQAGHIPTIDINKLYESGQEDVLVRPFADYLQQHHKNLALAHRHNFYHLVFFTKGSGSHTIDFKRFTLVPGQIYFMVPGQVHSWDFTGEVDGFVVNFTESFFKTFLLNPDYIIGFSFFNGVATDNVVNLGSDISVTVRTLFERMLLLASKEGFQKDMLRVLLLELFMLIEGEAVTVRNESIQPHNYALIRNYQKLVEQHFLALRLPKEYAEILSVTPNYLNAACKAHLGMQAGEIIRNRVILEAKRLLVNLTLNVAEVGYALNFSDNSYFTKFFRKHTGMTPDEFRKNNV